eukprot:gnl/Trimastix_PCT/451.p1 GENE.gnl/Trimastix_PCT/451~~gnl/Trimastix_PCT/451.p1  ORF type:complete len:397 (-),score=112.89 gnl/Trimastix_PCT/451:158-1291(-)
MSSENEPGVVFLPFEKVEEFMTDVFAALGVPAEDAATSAEVLITSDKRGIDSHGVGRCKPIYYDRVKAGILNTETNFEIVRETSTTAVIDGHNSFGHPVAKRACQMAIDKAKQHGLGFVVCRNSTHYGIAGYYSKMCADNGCVGMNGTNARPSIAPTFGIDNMLGTNPLSFGFPTDEEFPFVLDCATSVSQRGKIEQYARLGKTLPEGWVVSNSGETMTDPNEVLRALVAGTAAFTPLGGLGEETGGYKGYGYSVVVEVLSSALQAGNYMKMLSGMNTDGTRKPIELGHFFLAVNIEAFCELADFKKQAGDIMRALRNGRRVPGAERIFVAGEKEHEAYARRMALGGCPITQVIQREFIQMRDECNLHDKWRFPWEQ